MSEIEKIKPAKSGRLGRGLGSLLGDSLTEAVSQSSISDENNSNFAEQNISVSENKGDRVESLSVEKIERNPDQPRRLFDPEALRELSESIKSQGIIQPIVVKELSPNKYQIIAGERRWRAAQLAGLHSVPCVVRKAEEQQTLEMALVENIQRRDLNPIEEAKAYLNLSEKFKLTQQQIADKVGKERVTVANLMRTLHLPVEVQEMLERGDISLGQAKVLLSLKDEKAINKLARECSEKKLSVRAVEKLAEKMLEVRRPQENEKTDADRTCASLRENLQKTIGSKVEIDYSNGRGSISLFFYSDEQLNHLAEKVLSAWTK